MKVSGGFKLIGISMLLVAGLAACDKPGPGPAETAGRKLDQAADTVGEKIGGAVDRAGEKIGDAVDKVGEKLDAKSEKAGVAIEDAEITAKIKAAIFAEPGLKTLQISVDTIKGEVTLSGSVDSLSSRDRVKALAAAVAGVRTVTNRLVLK
jgi:hyperosmotically inducible protein